jgi:RND family efflux transporter MFP subunit
MSKRVSGKVVGAVILVGAVASVFLVDWKKEVEELPPPVRPLKTLVVGETQGGKLWKYPGKVSSAKSAEVAFEVAGTVAELPVQEGQQVVTGQLLAKLDPADYKNAAKAAKAEMDRAKAHLERIQKAAESNAVSKQEVSDALAAYDRADAVNDIRQKALSDTEIKAQFDGVIARTYVQRFENVQAKQAILSLQDLTQIEIEASIPESRIAQIPPEKRENKEMQEASRGRFSATFDYFDGRVFDLTLTEFAPDADPVTQTYLATFKIESADDVTILPGMTAMVLEKAPESSQNNADGPPEVPLDLVPVDGVGQYYVWLLEPDGDGVFSLTRRDVSVGEVRGDSITVSSGLQNGDRIAAAGVNVVVEGQKVRLLQAE